MKQPFTDPVRTLEDAIRAGARYLDQFDLVYGHGTGSSLDEAAWLVLEAFGLDPSEEPDYSMPADQAGLDRAADYLRRRAEDREPAAYITGRAWFCGLPFISDARALVPRSPLAEPIMSGFSDYLDPQGVSRVLDLCTGGGCIAIACSYAFPTAEIDASDISADALSLAAENVAMHEVGDRVHLHRSDLFAGLQGKRYDLIVSNPPYVDRADMAALSDEYLREPQLGLAAGDDGLDLVRTMLAEAAAHLNEGGVFICEVGNSAPALEAAYPDLDFRWLQFSHGGEGVFMLTRDDLSGAAAGRA
ncbi:50S ribosomal protein L3 N(5)-glutamine methyltransferase [Granulosicoccaceae sp. 1_MG-2023]|nr:50S ribosomal protein L3 N(5)-glutamine methyltransferase [Granulosicoccaceae sp. 1_MG-2023]